MWTNFARLLIVIETAVDRSVDSDKAHANAQTRSVIDNPDIPQVKLVFSFKNTLFILRKGFTDEEPFVVSRGLEHQC